MILAILEGIVMCFVLLIVCVVGIADGPVGMVFFYEKEVQDKAIELGLTTKETINRRKMITVIALLVPQFLLVPLTVYLVNGTQDFKQAAVQMTGTEDMMPYIYGKTLVGKWVSTLIGYPILAVIIAWVVSIL